MRIYLLTALRVGDLRSGDFFRAVFWFDGLGDRKKIKNQNAKIKIVELLRRDFISN
jgi:hypothetical protein